MKFTFIVVTYNSARTINNCLDAIIKGCSSSDRIIVFDNNSTDKTVEILKSYSSKIKLVASKQNLGFAHACNFCVQDTHGGSHIAFINPDCIIQPNLIQHARRMFSDEDFDLVGFTCCNADGSIGKNYRYYPSHTSGIKAVADAVAQRFARKPLREFDLKKYYLDGSCMFLKRSIFMVVGMFEDLFLYGEDVILCKKLREREVKVHFSYDHYYVHFRGDSSNHALNERRWPRMTNIVYSELYFHRNNNLFFKLTYVCTKVVEQLILLLGSLVFSPRKKEKITFYVKKMLCFFAFAPKYFIYGKKFKIDEFHTSKH